MNPNFAPAPVVHAISLDKANEIINAAFASAKQLGLKPLSVAVLDAGCVPLSGALLLWTLCLCHCNCNLHLFCNS